MREPVTTMEATSATSSSADWANAGVAAMKLRAAPPIMVEASKDSRTILFFKRDPLLNKTSRRRPLNEETDRQLAAHQGRSPCGGDITARPATSKSELRQ